MLGCALWAGPPLFRRSGGPLFFWFFGAILPDVSRLVAAVAVTKVSTRPAAVSLTRRPSAAPAASSVAVSPVPAAVFIFFVVVALTSSSVAAVVVAIASTAAASSSSSTVVGLASSAAALSSLVLMIAAEGGYPLFDPFVFFLLLSLDFLEVSGSRNGFRQRRR